MGARSVSQLSRNLTCLEQQLSEGGKARLEAATVGLKDKLVESQNTDPYETKATARISWP